MSPQHTKCNFLRSLGIIIVVIGVSETLVMLLLNAIHRQWGIELSPLQDTLFNITLLTTLSSPLLWFLTIRPLVLPITQEQRTSNKELLDALENHVLVSIADVQGRIVYANDMFCKVSGYTQNELVGQDHRIVNSGHHDQDYIRNMWHTIAGGQVWRGEFCNRRKNGELYWVDSTIAPVLDKAGKPKQYISIRRDTTTRKANELKLTALKRALDASSEMILITNAEGIIQYANPALCLFTGWTEDTLIGQKPYVLDSPTADQQALSDDGMDAGGRAMQGAIAEMQSRLRCGEAWSGRLRGRRRDNNAPKNGDPNSGQAFENALEYWAKTNITPIMMANGTLSGYVQIQHDVSKQVEEEAALQIETDDTVARLAISEVLHQPLSLEQRFIQVLDILFDLKAFNSQRKGCVLLRTPDDNDLEMFVTYCSPEQLKPSLHDELCGQAVVSKKLIVSDNCCCDGRQPHGHYIVPIASGEEILGVLLAYTDPYPVQNESRIAMLRQVGEMIALALLQNQANASLEAARDAALQVAHTKTEFLANMSHEIRTPMNGILGMLDLLQDTQLSREQWDLIEIAANSAESLLTIINDILDFSKLEAGKIELEQIEFNLQDLVEEVCTLLSSRAHDKGLELNCFLPSTISPRWQGDPTRIRQVLTNLIGNAIKFTEQGEVSIKVSAIAPCIALPPDLTSMDGGNAEPVPDSFPAYTPSLAIAEPAPGRFPAYTPSLAIADPAPGRLTAYTPSLAIADPAPGRLTAYTPSLAILRFEVVDTGIGITAETQTRLFQAFSQADNSTSRRYGGTGLGLSISKDLVVLMNGNIGVESALGRGATFWFTLPLMSVDNHTPVPQANFVGKRALIVDDNTTNRMILTHYLSNWGFALNETDNGPAALIELEAAVLRNKPYDLLLSDMQMPDMDGFALAQAILENPAIAGIPRILLSSGSIGSESERLSSGYTQSLLKPVRQSQLFDAIIAALQLPNIKIAPILKEKAALLNYSDKRVLVVEDNKVNQKVILSQLAKFQLKPDLVNNGQEALDQLEHQSYDLVFMDCQMPVMDGYEATRAWREREITAACPEHSRRGQLRTPITALTAHASAGEREKCLSAGMDDYLSKPVNRTDLAEVLVRWLGLPTAEPIFQDNVLESEIPLSPSVTKEEAEGKKILTTCWDEASALKRLDDDNDLLAEMIDLFLEEVPVQLAELAAAQSRTDLFALADAAHAIKGMAGHFCAEKIISLAVNLEQAARSGAEADFQLMAHDLTQATVDLVDNLLQRKKERDT